MKYENLGFIEPVIAEDHFELGGAVELGKAVLVPDGNWLPYLPEFEPQNKGYETYNCTSFATLNAVEMIMRRLYPNQKFNYSDRFLGIVAGTKPPGNDPHSVAQAIRHNGFILDEMLPFSDDLQNVEEYFSFKGADENKCREAGQEWLKKFSFGHEWVWNNFSVGNKQAKMMGALKYSPLGVSVQAWRKEGEYYIKDEGARDNHWTACVVGFEENKYWLIYDTYIDDGKPYKKLAWDYDFGCVKRYSITPLEEVKKEEVKTTIGIIAFFVNNYNKIFQPIIDFFIKRLAEILKPEPVIEPVIEEPKKELSDNKKNMRDLLKEFCLAIQQCEGWQKGSRSFRNNNPGNLRFVGQKLATGKDEDGFCIFATYEDGFETLKNMIWRAANGLSKVYNSEMTFTQFFRIYAPAEDKNNPDRYAENVAKIMKLPLTTKIKEIA